MQKIAMERLGQWFGESMDEYKIGFSNLVQWGALVFGLSLVVQFISFPVNMVAGMFPVGGAVAMVFVAMLGFCVRGISMVILLGAGLARWHGRESTWEDAKQDVSTHVQAILGILTTGVIAALLVIVMAIPGAALVALGAQQGDNEALIIPGVILIILLAIPTIVCVQALAFFTVPLIVDKRLDFWSAIMQSVDCVRRDFIGMVIFAFIYQLCYVIATTCLCLIGVILLAPFFGVLQMRAYRDYFGFEDDLIGQRLGPNARPSRQPMTFDISVQPDVPPPTAYPGYVPPPSAQPPPPPPGFGPPPPAPGSVLTDSGQLQVPPRTPPPPPPSADDQGDDERFPPPPPPPTQ